MLLCIAVVFLQIVLESYILGTLFHYIVKKDQAVEAGAYTRPRFSST